MPPYAAKITASAVASVSHGDFQLTELLLEQPYEKYVPKACAINKVCF